MEIRPTKMTTEILSLVINERPQAYSCIYGQEIEGTVCFYKYDEGTIMVFEVNNLPEAQKCEGGIFGFHIHEGNTCENNTAVPYEKTLGHYNPLGCEHPYHLGDLPPLFATKGKAWGIIYIDKFKPKDILNRTLVIHAHPDDFHTQPAGNSGEKIACGLILKFK